MMGIGSLLLCACTVRTVAQQDAKISLDDSGLLSQSVELIADGVRVVKVYRDSVVVDTFTIQEWISIPCKCETKRELEEYNKSLQMINEMIKKDE